MTTSHFSSFPCVGAFRELKFAQEKYWRKEISERELLAVAKDLCGKNQKHQTATSADYVAIGDFTFYDHILDLQVAIGAIPVRFGFDSQNLSLEQFFQLTRGNKNQFAIEMTKWLDTNYHYLVPELHVDTEFKVNAKHYVQQLQGAQALGLKVKPTIVGPLTFLWVGKKKGAVEFDRLSPLPKLLPVYVEILNALVEAGAEWIRVDEPALTVGLPKEWVEACKDVYATLSKVNAKVLLSAHSGSVAEHAALLEPLSVDGLHIDLVRVPGQLDVSVDYDKVLSAGATDGRSVWCVNLSKVLETVESLQAKLGDRLWISSSYSLLHTPSNLSVEEKLKVNKPNLYSWSAFTLRKIQELRVLKAILNEGRDSVAGELAASQIVADSHANSSETHRVGVAKRLADLPADADQRKSPSAGRIKA